MLKRFTIGWKILSGLTLLLILVIGTNYVIFLTQRKRIVEETLDTMSIMSDMARITLFETVSGLQRRTVDFSSDGFIRDATKEIVATGDKQVIATLGDHLRRNKQSLDAAIYGINILDTSGVVISSTDPNEIGENESNDPYYIKSEDLTYGSAYVSDFESAYHFKTDTVSLAISAPLTDRSTGQRIGMLMNFMRAEEITEALEKLNASLIANGPNRSSLSIFLVNKANLVIHKKYMDGDRLIKKLEPNDPTLQCGKKSKYTNIEGVIVIGSTLCMDNGWAVVTEISETQALTPVAEIQRNILVMVISLVVLILALMYLLTKSVIDPIKLLSASVTQIGKGYEGVRTRITSKDELGDLSGSFNMMAQSLESSHKMLEAKIREVTGDLEKFKLAVQGASDHIIITDTDGTIVYANKAAEETTGYSKEEMLGNRPSLWGKQMPQEFYRRMWRTIKEDKQSFHGEITNRRKNGRLYIAESHISPIFNEQGDLYGFVGVERDITRQKEIDKSKTEFVSIASHQLRTPLTIINWYVEMLTSPDSDLSEKQRQYLDEVTRASKRMIELVNALLNVSRIDMGTFMVDVQPLVFSDAMEEVLKDLVPQITEKQLTITRRYDSTLPKISADPKLLRMVFQNLLTNAVKYTPEKGSIQVGLKKETDQILITVTDTGLGIPAEQQSKIFEKFFRADNARTKEPDGNGLGLYIIKSLIEHSNGKIWFESVENKGTTFYVTLPLTGMKPKEGTRPLAA